MFPEISEMFIRDFIRDFIREFATFIIKHERDRKKEIRKANDNKGGFGQPNKPVHDVTSATPATSPTSAQGKGSL